MQAAHQIPCDPTKDAVHVGVSTLAGFIPGQYFQDFKQGNIFRLVRLADDLAAAETVPGHVLNYKAGAGLADKFVVTDDVTDAVTGTAGTGPMAAGVIVGAFKPSATAADEDARFVLVLVKGETTLSLVAGAAVAGDTIVANPAVDGGALLWDGTTLSLLAVSRIGTALADVATGTIQLLVDVAQ